MCEEIVDVLGRGPEQMPGWLGSGPPFEFSRDDFFRGRTLYYPGSGGDGHPVSVCTRSGSAHTFVYADYGPGRETIREWLDGPDPEELPQNQPAQTEQCGFRGYSVEYEEDVRESALRPGGWTPPGSCFGCAVTNEPRAVVTMILLRIHVRTLAPGCLVMVVILSIPSIEQVDKAPVCRCWKPQRRFRS